MAERPGGHERLGSLLRHASTGNQGQYLCADPDSQEATGTWWLRFLCTATYYYQMRCLVQMHSALLTAE